METKSTPNQITFCTEIGDDRVKVPGTSSLILRSRHIQSPATRVMAKSGARVALRDRGEKIVARIKFLANIAMVVNKHSVLVLATMPVSRNLAPNSATVALLFTRPPKSALR